MIDAAVSIIAHLRVAGATLEYRDGGRVRFSAPAPLAAALLAEAREHREAIASSLGSDQSTPLPISPDPTSDPLPSVS